MTEFLRRFKERTEKMKIGDPFDESTTVGAMITRAQADNVLRYIDIAKKEVGTSTGNSWYGSSQRFCKSRVIRCIFFCDA